MYIKKVSIRKVKVEPNLKAASQKPVAATSDETLALRSQLLMRKAELSHIKSENKQLRSEITALEADIDTLKRRCASLKESARKQKSINEHLTDEMRNLYNHCSYLEGMTDAYSSVMSTIFEGDSSDIEFESVLNTIHQCKSLNSDHSSSDPEDSSNK